MMYATSPVPQRNTKIRNNARHNHAGIGVCSPNPPQTPAIFLSVVDFFRFRTPSQKSRGLSRLFISIFTSNNTILSFLALEKKFLKALASLPKFDSAEKHHSPFDKLRAYWEFASRFRLSLASEERVGYLRLCLPYMAKVQDIFDSIRALGPQRLKLLGVITAGHFAIHWFQQLFPVVLPSIKSGLALSNVQVGALTAARQLVQGTLDFPLGIVADTMVKYRAIFLAAALASMGAGYVFMGISSAFFLAFCGAALIGLGTALWHPAAAASLSNRFPERRATALAVHGMGATVSDTLTPLGVGALLVAFYWESVLVMQVIPGLLAAFFVWQGLRGLFTEGESHPSRSAQFREILELARHPVFLGISAAKGLAMMGRLVVLTFLPIYLQEYLGYSPFALGLFIALLHAMGTISQPVLGFLSDRFGRKAVLFPSFVVQGALFILLGLVPAGLSLGVVIAANGLFFYTLMNVTYAAVMDVAGSKIQASSYGLASLVTEIVVVPTPVAAGFFIGRYGIKAAFLLAGAFVLLAGFVLLPLDLYRGNKRAGGI